MAAISSGGNQSFPKKAQGLLPICPEHLTILWLALFDGRNSCSTLSLSQIVTLTMSSDIFQKNLPLPVVSVILLFTSIQFNFICIASDPNFILLGKERENHNNEMTPFEQVLGGKENLPLRWKKSLAEPG